MTTVFLILTLVILFYMLMVFVIAQIKKDNSIVDVAWSIGVIVIALGSLLLNWQFLPKQILITSLVIVWGIRLAVHIHSRSWGKGEEFRFQKYRQEWGKQFVLRSFFQIFMLQALLMLLVSFPVILINSSNQGNITLLDILGLGIWLFGFFFEAFSDYQLLIFKSNPKNKDKIYTEGLWKFTRHPNYFGELTMWWGIYILALTVPNALLSIIGPLTLTVLLIKISGIKLMEKKYQSHQQYQKYIKTTSGLFPWFLKKEGK